MKNNLKLLTLLAVLPLTTGCTTFKYPDFNKEGNYKVGILLPVEHGALNKATEGFKEGLRKAGWVSGTNVTYITKNAQGSDSDQKVLAKQLLASTDLTLGLGTGASKDLAAAQVNRGSKNPILFTAVTDPAGSGLINSMEQPGGLITGTSDAQPVDKQIELIKECIPTVDKIGILYTQTESNSETQAKDAKQAAQAAGIEVTIKTCTNATDVYAVASALAAVNGIDAIYIPTDNNVASNMALVAQAVKGKNILVCTGEESMLAVGGCVTFSVDYTLLGERTGEMAAAILNGEKTPDQIPCIKMAPADCQYYINTKECEETGITLPQSIINKSIDLAPTHE